MKTVTVFACLLVLYTVANVQSGSINRVSVTFNTNLLVYFFFVDLKANTQENEVIEVKERLVLLSDHLLIIVHFHLTIQR